MAVMSDSAIAGELGELKAAEYLKKHGYKLTDHNFHSAFGEIDLIFTKRKYIVFVEVKTRSSNTAAAPCEAVDYAKRQRLIKTAQYYIMRYKAKLQPRFDVVEVILDNSSVKSIKHLENAFDLY